MERTCKICYETKPYNKEARTARLRGFHGYVCWKCIIDEQRAWRGTELGREESKDATAAYRARKKAL